MAGVAVQRAKPLLAMPASRPEAPGHVPAALLLIRLLLTLLGRQQMMVQVFGPLPPTMEIWMELLAPDFSLVQPQLLLSRE